MASFCCHRPSLVVFVVVVVVCCIFLSGGAQGMNFTCQRPTTPCDTWYGTCQPNDRCACSNGASGLRCQISGSAKRDAGNCLFYNPCVDGTCYDDGVVAKCDCPEGLYGEHCEHPMVYAECDADRMVMNIFPYGFDVVGANSPPLTGDNFTCQLSDMRTFLTKHPSFSAKKWDGFTAAFAHKQDACAGDATIVSDTTTSISYSRTVYISYSQSGPDPTDQTLEVTCDVAKVLPTPPPVVLPPARVAIFFRTLQGGPLTGSLKLGSFFQVVFRLNIPNSGNYDDAQVETCALRDTLSTKNVVIVDRKCAVAPVGEVLVKKAPGLAVLIVKVHRFPGMSSKLSFQCRVRVCNRNLDDFCSTPANCHMRGRRSVDSHTDNNHNVITVEKSITV